MSVLPVGLSRVSNLLQSEATTQSVDGLQSQLATVEQQLSTGLAISQPSDNPAAASMIMQLNQTLNVRQTYASNMNSASSMLGETDSTLGDLTTLLQQAQTTASANVGTGVTASERNSAATVVQSVYNQILSIANQTYNGQYLFGDDGGQTQPFTESANGVLYNGTGQTLSNLDDDNTLLSYQVDGATLFGSLTGQVAGATDLAPTLSATTRLTDVSGAQNQGVRLGSVQISDGTVTKTVDLSSASSVGDVVNLINNAAVGSITASVSGNGITLTGTGSENITVTDVGGTTAADLGIATPSTGEGTGNPDVGSSINPKVTLLTPVADLRGGAGIDNSGIIITNGQSTKTITWSPTGTVQDVLNAINGAGLGVTAQINSAGTGINVLNATQGTDLQIGENGGSTATELGIRTFDTNTPLTQLNDGNGVQTAGASTPDFQITASNGSTFNVTLNGAATVQDVLTDINTATGGAVTATLATTGNGIVLTDTTGGGGTLTVTPENNSTAASELGLTAAASGNTITGTDTSGVASNGIFANLSKLVTALQTNDIDGITAASQGITNDMQRVSQTQGQTGAIEQELQERQTQLTQENETTQSFLSQLQDTNMTQAITQYQQLQTALEASYETASRSLGLSLLDFLD
jgi:flagellar hook-associated protein 3 FlgL